MSGAAYASKSGEHGDNKQNSNTVFVAVENEVSEVKTTTKDTEKITRSKSTKFMLGIAGLLVALMPKKYL